MLNARSKFKYYASRNFTAKYLMNDRVYDMYENKFIFFMV